VPVTSGGVGGVPKVHTARKQVKTLTPLAQTDSRKTEMCERGVLFKESGVLNTRRAGGGGPGWTVCLEAIRDNGGRYRGAKMIYIIQKPG